MRDDQSDCRVRSAIFWMLLLTATMSAQSQEGHTIIGKVRTLAGPPVANVLVELHTGNGMLLNQTVTTNEGDFAFTGLTGASFIIVVDEPSHQPASERVELAREATTRPGETVRVEVVLTPKAKAPPPATGITFHQEVTAAALKAYQRGIKLLAEHKSEDGVAALREAISKMPDYFDAHFALALELFRLRLYSDATEALERARAINPKDSRLYHTFGLLLYEQKKYALASQVFAEAARLNPTDPGILLMRAQALIEHATLINPAASKEAARERETAFNLAEKDLTKAFDLSGKKMAAARLQLARLYEKRGARARAADELEEYLKMSPGVKNADAIREAIKQLRQPADAKKP